MFTTTKTTAMDARRHEAKKALLYAKRKYREASSPAKMDPAMVRRQQEFDEMKLLLLEGQLLADQDKKYKKDKVEEKQEEKQKENLKEEERAANEERKEKVAMEKRSLCKYIVKSGRNKYKFEDPVQPLLHNNE